MSNPSTPNIVLAPAPWDKDERVELFVSPETIRQQMEIGSTAKLGEYGGLVHGATCTKGLLDAHALFRGVQRPLGSEPSGDQISVYILAPEYTYVYVEAMNDDVQRFRGITRPADSVFAVYAEMREEGELFRNPNPQDRRLIPDSAAGIIRYWEWTMADRHERALPKEYKSRYRQQIW